MGRFASQRVRVSVTRSNRRRKDCTVSAVGARARACWTQYPPDGHLQFCVVAFATDEAPDFVHVRSPIDLCVSAAIVARLDTPLDAARSNAMGQHPTPHMCGEHGGGAPPQPDDAATQGRIKHYQEHRYPRSVTLCSSGNVVPNSGEPSQHGENGEQQTNRLFLSRVFRSSALTDGTYIDQAADGG
jgi:hypothetical protein